MSYQPQTSDTATPAPPPLDQPYYGISFGGAVARGFKKYATFAGRASRSEYWWWALFTFITYFVLGLAAYALGIATSRDGGRTPGLLALPLIILLLGLLPRNHHSYARTDRPPFARRRVQRAIRAAPSCALPGKLDHYDLRLVPKLAGWSKVRPHPGLAEVTGPMP